MKRCGNKLITKRQKYIACRKHRLCIDPRFELYHTLLDYYEIKLKVTVKFLVHALTIIQYRTRINK